MDAPDAHADVFSALEWKSYSVSRADKRPLLAFVLKALEMRGCHAVYASEPNRAPFFIVFDTPSGERQGVLVYAFFANSKLTANRPPDERRFQVKYGSKLLKGVLEVAIDPRDLITTLFLGIDLVEGIFIAADPVMNTPAPMSRSIEFKDEHVELIRVHDWAVWERDRRPGKSKSRPTAGLEDFRTEVLVGGKQERLLDLISLERLARRLDPGERHLLARRKIEVLRGSPKALPHAVLKEFGIEPEALFDLIEGASRLKMAVRGWVAEQHLFDALQSLQGVSDHLAWRPTASPTSRSGGRAERRS